MRGRGGLRPHLQHSGWPKKGCWKRDELTHHMSRLLYAALCTKINMTRRKVITLLHYPMNLILAQKNAAQAIVFIGFHRLPQICPPAPLLTKDPSRPAHWPRPPQGTQRASLSFPICQKNDYPCKVGRTRQRGVSLILQTVPHTPLKIPIRSVCPFLLRATKSSKKIICLQVKVRKVLLSY